MTGEKTGTGNHRKREIRGIREREELQTGERYRLKNWRMI
jgi:hypothetical protein